MDDNYSQLVAEQREEIKSILQTGWVTRAKEKDLDPESRLVQIITGIRRSGKSTLAHRALRGTNYAYANFDDERLGMIKAKQLNLLLEALYREYGDFSHLLLDEIQNIEGWHLFVNRLQRNNIRIVITGSNSKLLSSEFASHLTGRYSVINLFPYSFKEFLSSIGASSFNKPTARSRGLTMGHLDKYLQFGGFPEPVKTGKDSSYLNELFNAIVTRDILFRYNIRHTRTFKEIASFLLSNFGKEISYNRIKNIFGLGSENTAKTYVAYLEEAWLILTLPKFSFKKQESLKYRKVYNIDTGLCQISGLSFSQNLGRILENAVFLDLQHRSTREGYEVYYYKKTIEVDFVIYKKRKVDLLVQVCLSIDNGKTRNREIRALIQAGKELSASKYFIVTMDNEETINADNITIEVVRIADWLLRE
jgi:predicted AAA+ superfamily ATPase